MLCEAAAAMQELAKEDPAWMLLLFDACDT